MQQKELVPSTCATTALVPITAMAVNIQKVKEKLAANLGPGGMTVFDLQRIKIPTGGGIAYTVPELNGEQAVQKFRCVVIHHRDGRAYWPDSVNETGGGLPPVCHSNDGLVGIGSPGGSCLECPLAQYGSGREGRGQACKQIHELFLYREGSDSNLPEVFIIPPTSLRPWRKFAVALGSRLVGVSDVLAEIGLQQAKSQAGITYAQATFQAVRLLTPEEVAKVNALAQVFQPLFGQPISAPPAAEDPADADPAPQPPAPAGGYEPEPEDEDRPF